MQQSVYEAVHDIVDETFCCLPDLELRSIIKYVLYLAEDYPTSVVLMSGR